MKRALLLLALPFALAAAGCGGGDTLTLDAVANAADRTAAQKSAKFDMSIQLTLPGTGQPLRVFANGAFDQSGKRARVEMDLAELMSAFGAPAGSMKMTMLFDHPTIYMQLPPEGMQSVGATTPWVKVDVSKLTGGALGSFGQFSQNPTDQLALLRAVSGEIEKRGTKEIRGVRTTHYHATVDMQKALDQGLSAVGGGEMRKMLEEAVAQAGFEDIPIDVWLDDSGVLHRMVLDMQMPAAAQSLRMAMTMDLYDFGAPVDVTPPPASQVTDVTAQAQAQGG